jgi:CspA family cold shock protein
VADRRRREYLKLSRNSLPAAKQRPIGEWHNHEVEHMAEGTIKRLITDKGFGFILTETGEDLFFHKSSVEGVTFDSLQVRQRVSYSEGRGPKGPCAEHVSRID